MSDPKRSTLITVGATKSEKNKVNKTVRLTINLVESNESKYPELNYKELVIAEEKRHRTIENGKNGKTSEGLNPYSDNDDDVERVARKFEQKYGGKSTYGRKGRSKHDEFADIGAGYDENDSFIDNTDGYDEMIPPECDTLYGGFYINSGSLEFKNVEPQSDDEPRGRRNKRRISSSSSEEDSSESSSESEGSHEEKEPKPVANGAVDSLHTEHRKKKNKKNDKKKAKKIRRTDSSAATSGKQTSDDNAPGEGESADSRTSQSDSLTSKPAPSSENPATSDSSRDVEAKVELKLPAQVATVLEELETLVSTQPAASHKEVEASAEPYIIKLERALCALCCARRVRGAAWARAARALRLSRTKLLQRARQLVAHTRQGNTAAPPTSAAPPSQPPPHKRKSSPALEHVDTNTLTDDEREAKIVETLQRLKALIDERKPGMMANYNAECERVQEERKKIQIASAAEGAPAAECTKRLPKRRFPWCPRTRALLARLVALATDQEAAALLLAKRALPLFPNGFVRMPTLLRQADLSKELKVSDVKRQRTSSHHYPPTALPNPNPAPTTPTPTTPIPTTPTPFPEPLHFPSSLTVTTTTKTDKPEDKDKTVFGTIINSFTLSKDLIVEKQEDKKDEKKDDLYIPPNNIGSITITPVVNNQAKAEKKVSNVVDNKKSESLIRVKSPAALNEMIHKQEKNKALENIHKREKHRKDKSHSQNDKTHKEKRVNSPLHIDTSYQNKKEPTPSPKNKEEVSLRQIESMRLAEGNIPRPGLIPVHHSPTFAKPDKRPPEKKKKDIVIVSDMDPLADVQTVDDSSSDVELVEDKSEKSDASETVPSKEPVSARDKDGNIAIERTEEMDQATKDDFDSVMKNLRDLEHSREAPKYNSSSYGGVITSANREKSSSQFPSRGSIFAETRSDKNKLTNFFEQNGWM